MYLHIIFMLCVIGLGFSSDPKKPLKVTVFYESYCLYCKIYMAEQLLPAFKKFSSNIQIDLVPFGNAEQYFENGKWVFDCQHGEKECYANKMQACAILQACGEKGSVQCTTDKMGQLLTYITCLESVRDQKGANNRCANVAGLASQRITDCATGDEGDRLLNMYGNRTYEFIPYVEYVPFVVINNDHSESAEEDLRSQICKMRPGLC